MPTLLPRTAGAAVRCCLALLCISASTKQAAAEHTAATSFLSKPGAQAANASKPAGARLRGARVFLHGQEAAEMEVGDVPQITSQAAPYVVVAIFSGRGERMRLLLPYLDRLRANGQIHEVHFWDFTQNEKDRKWIAATAHKNNYTLLNFMGPRGYGQVYDYYASFKRPTGTGDGPVVIVKADDDIVYLDTDAFSDYTRFTATNRDMLLVHANVVNNGVAAYYQFKHQPALSSSPLAVPLRVYPDKGYGGPLWESGALAAQLHDMFLGDPTAFRWGNGKDDTNNCLQFHEPTMTSQGRFSVNFFAARQPAWATLAELVKERGGDDEDAVTSLATADHYKECMFTPFNAVHLSFQTQAEAAMYASRYEQLLERQGLHPPPGPDDPCAASEGGQFIVEELLRLDHEGDDLPDMPMKGIDAAKCKSLCNAADTCKGIEFVFQEDADSECYLKADVRPNKFSDPFHCLWKKPTAGL